MTQPGFWDEPEKAQEVVQQKKRCFQVVEPIDAIARLIEDGRVLLELGEEDPAAVEVDLKSTAQQIRQRLDELEFQLMLGGEHDIKNAIVTIQPGAGGVDASGPVPFLPQVAASSYLPRTGTHARPLAS